MAIEPTAPNSDPPRRPVPGGLAMAVQAVGALSIPDSTGAALGWILRLGGASRGWADIRALIERTRTLHNLETIVSIINDEHSTEINPPHLSVHWDGSADGPIVLLWVGHITPGRWAMLSILPMVQDVSGGWASQPAVIAWDEGERRPDAQGWSRWLDIPRAFGAALADAIEVPAHDLPPIWHK